MRINQNIAAMNAYRNLSVTQGQQSKSLERLSSGFRINRAADDAAGLAISEKLRGQVGGLNQAVSNAQNGISLLQTAEGALNESHSILQRMRELAVQSASDTNTDADRTQIQKEVNQLSQELSRIGSSTEFNTKSLLNGDRDGAGALTFQIGANEGQSLNVKIGDMRGFALGATGAISATAPAGTPTVIAASSNHSLAEGSYTATGTGTNSKLVDAAGNTVATRTATGVYTVAGSSATYTFNTGAAVATDLAEGATVSVAANGTATSAGSTSVTEGTGAAAPMAGRLANSSTFDVFNNGGTLELRNSSGVTVAKATAAGTTATTFLSTATAEAATYTFASAIGADHTVTTDAAGDASATLGAAAGVAPAMTNATTGGMQAGSYTVNASNSVLDSTGQAVGSYDSASGNIYGLNDAGAVDTSVTLATVASGTRPAAATTWSFEVNGTDVSTAASASTAITTIQTAIDRVSDQRSTLGAVQNRLDHTINNLNVASENLSASESRIRDTDMASEMMNFTRAQILSQAGTAMLAQANQVPQSVLSLLR